AAADHPAAEVGRAAVATVRAGAAEQAAGADVHRDRAREIRGAKLRHRDGAYAAAATTPERGRRARDAAAAAAAGADADNAHVLRAGRLIPSLRRAGGEHLHVRVHAKGT